MLLKLLLANNFFKDGRLKFNDFASTSSAFMQFQRHWIFNTEFKAFDEARNRSRNGKACITNLLCKLACRCKDQSLALLQGHIEFLENSDSERGCFAGARLRLSNHVMTLDARYDCALLDCRRLLKAIGIDSTQQVLLEAHVIKVVHHLIPVALQYNQHHHHDGPSSWLKVGCSVSTGPGPGPGPLRSNISSVWSRNIFWIGLGPCVACALLFLFSFHYKPHFTSAANKQSN